MQYIYERYGRERAGIAATVIHYRSRSTVREVGKVLGLSEDVTARLSSTAWGSYSSDMPEKRFTEAGFDSGNPEMIRLRSEEHTSELQSLMRISYAVFCLKKTKTTQKTTK